MRSYPLIIPCADKDANFVAKVIQYIRKNLIEVGMIYVITAPTLFIKCSKTLKGYENVCFVDENKLIEKLNYKLIKDLLAKKKQYVKPGWYFQQFLKMGFALTDYADEYYLSWDADTLPLSKLRFIEDGHPIFTVKKEYHPAYFETMEKLIGIGKTYDYSFIAEHMLFKTSIMRELIEKINTNDKLEGENWIEKIINTCEFSQTDYNKAPYFSEFETYATYTMIHYPYLYTTRHLNTFRNAGYIRGRKISDKMLTEISFDLDMASFEYGATPPFPYNINAWLHKTILPKFEKIRNMPIKNLPKHFLTVFNRRILRKDL